MRWLALVAVLVVSGCPNKVRVRHVYVPKSSAPCWRECKSQSIQCLQIRVRSEERRAHAAFCEDQRLDCLLTCDGAEERPPVEVEDGSWM